MEHLPLIEQLRRASRQVEEVRAAEVEGSGSRLRTDQSRVASEFGRFVGDAAEIVAAGGEAPFGRIIQPPRTGKTVVAAHLIARTRLPSVFIVPSRALVGQTAREMASHAPSVPVGTFYGERKQVVANRMLASAGDPGAGCDEDRRVLLEELLETADDGRPARDFADGWRAATGGGDAPSDWPDARLLGRERQEEVSRLLDQLTRRKRRIAVEHFGLEGRDEATFGELAEAFDVSTSRVSQIMKAALRKLKHGTHLDEAGHVRWRLIGPRSKA